MTEFFARDKYIGLLCAVPVARGEILLDILALERSSSFVF